MARQERDPRNDLMLRLQRLLGDARDDVGRRQADLEARVDDLMRRWADLRRSYDESAKDPREVDRWTLLAEDFRKSCEDLRARL